MRLLVYPTTLDLEDLQYSYAMPTIAGDTTKISFQ
jgi:hypothetical protein